MRLHTRVQGSGFPMLCLHGHPGSGQSMAVFTDALSNQLKTIAPDLRGYGRSQTRQPFEMAAHLEDLVELLDTHGVDQCWVLGWSLGGILAMEMALQYPERVRGLILVATAAHPRGNHPPVTWLDNLNTGIASLLNRAVPGHPWVIKTFGQRSLYRYLIQQHTPYAYRQLATAALPAYLQTSRQATQALYGALRAGYNRLPQVRALTMPCLMLCGDSDRHITSEASVETAETLPRCDLRRYPQVAHLFPWEIPDQVLADIQSWLKQNPPHDLQSSRRR
ncbi:alpha/beta hydrolase [filamentous cyanobacterium CCP5]|nr:alpha/beta hydrolase [filamentous cyanobacterium CCP5]